MISRRPTSASFYGASAVVAIVFLAFLAASFAFGITPGTPTTTLSDGYAGVAGVTYTFSGYTVANGEMATGAAITFPADTNVGGATLLSPAGTLSVSGQTVTVTFVPNIMKGNPVVISIGGITNPTTPGTYTVGTGGTITFFTANPNNNQARAPQSVPSAAYVISAPILTLTVTTPDPGQTVDFGAIYPEVTTAAKTVTLDVNSSASYSITRTLGGAQAALQLSVTGSAEGINLPAGPASYTDSYTVTPLWTTDPEIPITASVTYSVVQY